jgi:glycosyltransferase involved in cell wall biosynthesis
MTTDAATCDLGVAMTAHNSMRTIERSLRSVAGLAKRIVVVDSGSTDGTLDLCRSLGAEVIPRPWTGYASQKRFSIEQCDGCAWQMVLDSDESLEPELAASIRAKLATDDRSFDGWEVNRKVWFQGGWLNHTFQPEWRLRLFRTGRASVVGQDPHDRIEVPGRVGRLAGDLRHDSWADLADMVRRYLKYAQVCTEQDYHGGRVLNILFNPPASMIKQLVLKRGFLDGRRGLIAAGGVGIGTMLKHLTIAQQRLSVENGSA